jgi:hypothetical protein
MTAETKPSRSVEPPGTSELEVRGPELSLRYARPEDAPRLFELASNAEVTRYFS